MRAKNGPVRLHHVPFLVLRQKPYIYKNSTLSHSGAPSFQTPLCVSPFSFSHVNKASFLPVTPVLQSIILKIVLLARTL
jgi:hypothetical protein